MSFFHYMVLNPGSIKEPCLFGSSLGAFSEYKDSGTQDTGQKTQGTQQIG